MIDPSPPRTDPAARIDVVLLAALVFISMISSTLVIPIVRPFMAALHPEHEGAMHAFMTVNMAGAIIGAPLVAWFSDRSGQRRAAIIGLALLDGLLLYACSLPMPTSMMLALRTLQGAANVGGLSLLMGIAAGRDRAMGIVGAALMMAVAMGAPLGTFLLRWGPTAPLRVGALLPLCVAAVVLLKPLHASNAARKQSLWRVIRSTPHLKVPTLLVATERFVVGCFVVTFALYGHRVLALNDAEVGSLFTWFLLPFALCTWPLGRVAGRLNRVHALRLGAGLFGLIFVTLGSIPVTGLWLAMLLAGLASAAIYAPALCLTATLAPRGARGTAMALLNAGGSLGMMLGTATGGILSAVLLAKGWQQQSAYSAIFQLAGLAQLVGLLLLWPALTKLGAHQSPSLARAQSCPAL